MIGADDPPLPAPLLLDLLAAVLDGGSPPAAALRAIAIGLEDAGDNRARALLLISGRLDNPMSASPGRYSIEGGNSIEGSYALEGKKGIAGIHALEGRYSLERRYSAGGKYSAEPDHLTEPSGDRLLAELEKELLLAARSGLAPSVLIRRAAADSRRKQAAAQLKAIRRLEVMIVVPAGVCLLPAFVLLGVVPLMIGLLRG